MTRSVAGRSGFMAMVPPVRGVRPRSPLVNPDIARDPDRDVVVPVPGRQHNHGPPDRYRAHAFGDNAVMVRPAHRAEDLPGDPHTADSGRPCGIVLPPDPAHLRVVPGPEEPVGPGRDPGGEARGDPI